MGPGLSLEQNLYICVAGIEYGIITLINIKEEPYLV